jgi:hypothetical protein
MINLSNNTNKKSFLFLDIVSFKPIPLKKNDIIKSRGMETSGDMVEKISGCTVFVANDITTIENPMNIPDIIPNIMCLLFIIL